MTIGINKMSTLDFSATDLDGDSLAHFLVPAWNGFNSFVSYLLGLSGQFPIVSSYINLNTSTGFFSVIPTTAQIGVVAVKVEE